MEQKEHKLTEEEIIDAWYSMGFKGGSSQNDWNVRFKFARELEKRINEINRPRHIVR